MWKDFVAINGSECVRALICIAIDDPLGGGRRKQLSALTPTPATVNLTEGITYSEASLRSLMAAKSSPGGFVVATVTNPGSFMATITHPTGNGYCRDRILRDSSFPGQSTKNLDFWQLYMHP